MLGIIFLTNTKPGQFYRANYGKYIPKTELNFFEGLSGDDIEEILRLIDEQPKDSYKPSGRIKSMTANDFYKYYCAIGYEAMSYKTDGMTPKELYFRYADGRDEELSSIDLDSETAFREWLKFGGRGYGHPWK